jgi:hypothetical protein
MKLLRARVFAIERERLDRERRESRREQVRMDREREGERGGKGKPPKGVSCCGGSVDWDRGVDF